MSNSDSVWGFKVLTFSFCKQWGNYGMEVKYLPGQYLRANMGITLHY